jgi:cytochrome P450
MEEQSSERSAVAGELAITDPAVARCPYPFYERLLDREGVPEDPMVGWMVGKFADVARVTTEQANFSNRYFDDQGPRHMGVGTEPLSAEVEQLLTQYHKMDYALAFADPPDHRRHRSIALKSLNPRRVRKLRSYMREVAEELVDGFVDDGHCELHSQFGINLPLIVIADTLGVDRKDLREFKHWSDCMIAGNLDVLDNTRRAEVARAVIDFQAYFLPRIAERRDSPRDDLLSDLVNDEADDVAADGDGDRHLKDSELLAIVSQLLLAGNETTTNLIGNGLVLLTQHPEAMAEVRSDYRLIPNFLEETLRYDGPVHCVFRKAKRDTEMNGSVIPAGSTVLPVLGAASQDPEVFSEPRRFDIHRSNAKKHMTFGHGPHFCVGAEMARVEGQVAFETLFDRLGDIRLAPDALLEHHQSFSTRGYKEIRIEFDPRA